MAQKVRIATNMLQLKVPQSWMMKYSCIPRWIHANIPLMLHRIQKFLATIKHEIRTSKES